MKKTKIKRIKRHPIEDALIYKTVIIVGHLAFPTVKGATGYDLYGGEGNYIGSVGKAPKYIKVKVV